MHCVKAASISPMFSRREFLTASIGTLSLAFAGGIGFAETHRRLGVQLYTVRKQAESDLPGVLKRIRAIGYDEVETYWNVYSHPAKELRQMITDAGLKVPSAHFNYAGLPDKLDYARELGVEYVVCPMLPENMRDSLDGFAHAAENFNQWGERTKSMGMRFGFHNHNYEFRKFGETTGFDTLVARTDPKLVCFEMDCYWITQAGQDPVAMLERLGKRIRLLHLKDRKPGFPSSQQLNSAAEHFTEVGSGSIDWKKILDLAQKDGIEHSFVEQDETERPPIESLRISYKNLEAIPS